MAKFYNSLWFIFAICLLFDHTRTSENDNQFWELSIFISMNQQQSCENKKSGKDYQTRRPSPEKFMEELIKHKDLERSKQFVWVNMLHP